MRRRFQAVSAARLPFFILLLSQNHWIFYPGNLFVLASTGMDAQTLRSLGMSPSEIETILGTRNSLTTSKTATGTVERSQSPRPSTILGGNVSNDIKTNENRKEYSDYDYDEFDIEEDIFTMPEENKIEITDDENNEKDSNEVILSSELNKDQPLSDESTAEVQGGLKDEIEINNDGAKKKDEEWWKDPFNNFDETDDHDDIDDTEIRKIEEQAMHMEEFEEDDFTDELPPEDEIFRTEEDFEEDYFSVELPPEDDILKMEEEFEEEDYADELPPEDEILKAEEYFEEEDFADELPPEDEILKVEEYFEEEDFADELPPEDEILQMEEDAEEEGFSDELFLEDDILKMQSKSATEDFPKNFGAPKMKEDLDVLNRKGSINKTSPEDSEESQDLNNAIFEDDILLEDDNLGLREDIDKGVDVNKKSDHRLIVDEKIKLEADSELDLDGKLVFSDDFPPKEDIIDVTKASEEPEEDFFTDELLSEEDFVNERAKVIFDDEYDEYEEYDIEELLGIEDSSNRETEYAPKQLLAEEPSAENADGENQYNEYTETLVEKENKDKVMRFSEANNEKQAIKTHVKKSSPSKSDNAPLECTEKAEQTSEVDSVLIEHNSSGTDQTEEVGSMGTDQDITEDIIEPRLTLVKDIKAAKASELKNKQRQEKHPRSNGITSVKKPKSLSVLRGNEESKSVSSLGTKDIEPMLSTLKSGSEEHKSRSLGGSTLPILILPKLGRSLMASPLVVQFFAAASIGNIAIQQMGALSRRRKSNPEGDGMSGTDLDAAKITSDIEVTDDIFDVHDEYDQSEFVEVKGDYGFGRPKPQRRAKLIDDAESENEEAFEYIDSMSKDQSPKKKSRKGVKLWGNSSNSKSEVMTENTNDKSQELKIPKKRVRGFGFMGKQALSYEYALAMEQVEKMNLRVQKAESTRDQYEIDCDRAMQQVSTNLHSINATTVALLNFTYCIVFKPCHNFDKLRELKKELSEVGKTNTYLKNQLADNKRILERAVNVERQKTNTELARLREQMVEVLERERRMMRAQLMKSSAEVRALIGESMSDEYDFVDDYDVGDN